MTLKEIKDYIVAKIYNNTTQKITGDVLQNTLTTMADSMNTPSGDPMHYAYEAEGAVWNASTGFWEMYDMTDITNEQMRRAYNFGHFNTSDIGALSMPSPEAFSNIRFNLPRTGTNAAYFSSFGSFASGNWSIEVINLMGTHILSGDKTIRSQIVNASYAFNYCEELRRILSYIDFSPATNVAGMFRYCFKLESVNCYSLKQDISFADSPNLSKESILYMINNSAATSVITITLHPTAYAMANADADIKSALTSKTYVKLASA